MLGNVTYLFIAEILARGATVVAGGVGGAHVPGFDDIQARQPRGSRCWEHVCRSTPGQHECLECLGTVDLQNVKSFRRMVITLHLKRLRRQCRGIKVE